MTVEQKNENFNEDNARLKKIRLEEKKTREKRNEAIENETNRFAKGLMIAQKDYDTVMFKLRATHEEIIYTGTEYYLAGLEYLKAGKPKINQKAVLAAFNGWEDYCEVTDNNQIPTIPVSGSSLDKEIREERARQKKQDSSSGINL